MLSIWLVCLLWFLVWFQCSILRTEESSRKTRLAKLDGLWLTPGSPCFSSFFASLSLPFLGFLPVCFLSIFPPPFYPPALFALRIIVERRYHSPCDECIPLLSGVIVFYLKTPCFLASPLFYLELLLLWHAFAFQSPAHRHPFSHETTGLFVANDCLLVANGCLRDWETFKKSHKALPSGFTASYA